MNMQEIKVHCQAFIFTMWKVEKRPVNPLHRSDDEVEKNNENDANNHRRNVFHLTLESIHKPEESQVTERVIFCPSCLKL